MTRQACEIPATGPAATLAASLRSALPVIETQRLRLRAPDVTDFATYADIYMSPRWPHDAPVTRHGAWVDFCEMASGWLWRGTGILSVTRRDDDTLLGFVVLTIEYGDPELELGWMLSDSAEGHGYAAKAAAALRHWADRTIGVVAPVSYINATNARSIALAERLGAQRDGQIANKDGVTLIYRHTTKETTEQS